IPNAAWHLFAHCSHRLHQWSAPPQCVRHAPQWPAVLAQPRGHTTLQNARRFGLGVLLTTRATPTKRAWTQTWRFNRRKKKLWLVSALLQRPHLGITPTLLQQSMVR